MAHTHATGVVVYPALFFFQTATFSATFTFTLMERKKREKIYPKAKRAKTFVCKEITIE